MVYSVIPVTNQTRWHSFNITFTALLYISILTQQIWPFALLIIIKLLLYLNRKKSVSQPVSWTSILRITTGFLMPVVIILMKVDLMNMFLVGFVFIGEVIDRIEFYRELDIITPEKQMQIDYQKAIGGK